MNREENLIKEIHREINKRESSNSVKNMENFWKSQTFTSFVIKFASSANNVEDLKV